MYLTLQMEVHIVNLAVFFIFRWFFANSVSFSQKLIQFKCIEQYTYCFRDVFLGS